MSSPEVLCRSTTSDGYAVVAWSTGSISPNRLVASYVGMEAGPRKHREADADAARQIVSLASATTKAAILLALGEIRRAWRNHHAGGDRPSDQQVMATLDQTETYLRCAT